MLSNAYIYKGHCIAKHQYDQISDKDGCISKSQQDYLVSNFYYYQAAIKKACHVCYVEAMFIVWTQRVQTKYVLAKTVFFNSTEHKFPLNVSIAMIPSCVRFF